MKTIIKLLPLCLFALAGTSCIKDEITKEYITENNTYIGVQNYVYDFDVRTTQWEYCEDPKNPLEPWWMCSVSVDGLTQYAYDFGQFSCYLDLDGYQQVLPVVRHHNNGEILWTETVDFEFGVGCVNVICTPSDFYMEEKPESMWFRLVISYDRTQDPDFKENR